MKPCLKDKLKCFKNIASDGCTGVPDFNFRSCCEEHDMHYRLNTGLTRKEADILMRKCIQKKWGGFFLPWIYYFGVRLIGWRFFKSYD